MLVRAGQSVKVLNNKDLLHYIVTIGVHVLNDEDSLHVVVVDNPVLAMLVHEVLANLSILLSGFQHQTPSIECPFFSEAVLRLAISG